MDAMTYDFGGAGRIRIGYRTPGLSGTLSPKKKMILARDLGMAVVEPQLMAREFPDPSVAEAMRDAAETTGIRIRTAGIFLDLTVPGAEATVDTQLEDALGLATTMNVEYLFVCASHPPDGVPQPEVWPLLTKNLRRCLERVEAAGMRLALEPEWFIGSVERMERLLGEVDRPSLRVNFDPTNFYLCGSDPLEAIRRFGDRIENGHIKDAVYQTDRKSEVPVGEGEVDYPAIFRAMIDAGIHADMHIEHCSQAEQVRAGAEHIRGVMQQLMVDAAQPA